MRESESPATEIARWRSNVAISKQQREADGKIRRKYVRWYMNKFWPDGETGSDEKRKDRRQVPYVGMFARHLVSNLWANDPQFTVASPWNVPQVNMLLGRVASKLPEHLGLTRTAQRCLLDLAVGRYTAVQVGYEAKIGWDADGGDRERAHAQEEGQTMLMGIETPVKEAEDHGIHLEEHQQDLQRAAEAQNPDAIELLQGHIAKHKEHGDQQLASPFEFVADKSVWAARIPPMRDGKISFGWQVDSTWEEAEWFWRFTVRRVADLQRDPYLSNTADLQPTHTRKDMMKETEYEALDRDIQQAIEADAGLVGVTQLINRETQKELIYADGHEKWLFNDRFPHADLFEGTGVHVLALEMDPDEGSGKTPTEDAASAIIVVNHGQGKLVDIMDQTAPSKIYDLNKIDAEDVKAIQRREIGEAIGIKAKNTDDLRKIMVDWPGARLPMENLAAMNEGKETIGASFGIGDTGLGGTDVSKTATASFAASTAQTGNIEGWARTAGRWASDIVCDALQGVKSYYDDSDTVLRLIGVEDAPFWMKVRETLKPWPEVVRCKVGSTMPGRADAEKEQAMAILTTTAGHPLVEARPVLEDFFRAFGKDPDRMMVSREKEAQRAATQPGDQPEMVGGPEVEAGEGERESEAQTPDELQREVRSKASERSAEMQRS
jgi:hypothetical protein